MSKITDKVEWWLQVVAVREHDQRYYPSENHAADLLEARCALRRARRCNPDSYEAEILRDVESVKAPTLRFRTNQERANSFVARADFFSRWYAVRKVYLQTAALEGATDRYEILKAWRTFLIADKIYQAMARQCDEAIEDMKRHYWDRRRGIVRHYPRRAPRIRRV